MYHKSEMHVTVSKANQEKTKPVVVCDYNINMLGVDLKDQMLQPCLLERKKGTKWYLKLFKRLLSVAVHNAMVIYWCLPNNKKHRLTNIQAFTSTLWKSTVLEFLVLYIAVHQLNHHLKDLQNDIFWTIFQLQERRQDPIENVWCAQNMGKGETLFIGAVNVKQACV
jgi:hypothetical protein